MNLNHINLTSRDVPADRSMFETYIDMQCTFRRGDDIAVLRDQAGMFLFLNNFAKLRGDFRFPDDYSLHHVGFLQETKEKVDEVWEALDKDGWEASPPRNFHGAWTFYFKAKGGYYIEVGTETKFA